MIVVTGGTGLVGGYLLLKLAQQGNRVRVLVRPGTDPGKVFSVWKHYIPDPEVLFTEFEWYSADLSCKAELYEALDGAEYIYHCAGKVSFDNRDKKEMWKTNALLTSRIVDFCLENKVKKLAYVSSVAAIASDDSDEISESKGWPVGKKSAYPKTKTLGEFEVWRGIAEGLKAVIVNPAVIIGPGNWKQSSSRIFDTVYHGLPFYTEGVTGFVDNRDVADALVQLMNSDISGERFILNAANLSYRELFQSIAKAFGTKLPGREISPFLTSVAWRLEWIWSRLSGKEARLTRETAQTAHHVNRYNADKIRETLGFKFRDIQESIKETAACYLKERSKKQVANRIIIL
jgi:dihydroflavonol-4-reductase